MRNESKNQTSDTIVYFDGVCGFCNKSVDFLLRHDKQGRLKFSPLQGETAARVLPIGLREDLQTMVVTKNGKTYRRSEAALQAAKELPWPWSAAAKVALWVPGFLRNGVYSLIARYRYKLFGKLPTCRLPSAEERSRFLP